MIFEDKKIDSLIAQCRFAEACAVLTLARAESRLRAGVYALAGDERGVARCTDPEQLACRTGGEIAAHYAVLGLQPTAYDGLAAGTVLAWSADSGAAYDAFRAAHDRAISDRDFHLAVAARERLAHHALLLGDIEVARNAIEQGIALAQAHRLSRWSLRCLAAAVRLALDAGDLDRTADLLTRAKLTSVSPADLALFAATGAQLAVELGDDSALREWSSPGILDVALHCQLPEAAIAATIALLIAAGVPAPGTPNAMALRRALFQADGAANAPELFSLAARCGDLDEARFGVESLTGVVGPNRPYLKAHQLLARAHFLMRSGDRVDWIDCAGDAARAFSAMGLRRWTNEAMRLLVSREPSKERQHRRATGSALTGREEQVANLIRRGARNREVAIALQISEHTVERHVSSILGRLGLRSRWQIVDPRKSGEH